jgi:hypothetical protein
VSETTIFDAIFEQHAALEKLELLGMGLTELQVLYSFGSVKALSAMVIFVQLYAKIFLTMCCTAKM